MADTGQQIMISGADANTRLVKLEDVDSELSSANPQTGSSAPKLITISPDNMIKQVVKTADGQYIIITNGTTPFLQPIVTSSLPLMTSPNSITTSAGTDNKSIGLPSQVIGLKTIAVSSVSTNTLGSAGVTSVAQGQTVHISSQGALSSGLESAEETIGKRLPEAIHVGDVLTLMAEQVAAQKSLEAHNQQDSTSISAFHADTDNQSNIQSDSQPSTSKIIPQNSGSVKRLKLAPQIVKASPSSKTPLVLTPQQIQLATSLGGLAVQSLATPGLSGSSLVATDAAANGSEGLTDFSLQDGTAQLLIQKVEQDDAEMDASQSASSTGVHFVQDNRPPCPICSDKISGYHYGIFTCESCKGFFKRTVQNKKAFICHRKGDCDINVIQRKKCPACRFKRCLLAGMKLEAVREDRQRGGRSSYDGAQNYARARAQLGVTSPRPKAVVVNKSKSAPVKKTVLIPTGHGNQLVTMVFPEGTNVSHIQPQQDTKLHLQPHTPAILEDLMSVESLMNDDEAEQDCCHGKFVEGDDNLFTSLLHFADHCLYRIVRWARNLPDFASVSTDDQILLLQNCWGELLCLCCCWNSIRCHGEVKVASGRMLNMEVATLLGIEDLVQRLLDYIGLLRDLELDSREFIALKTLLLLNPDVKNLRDHRVIRQYQDRISSALQVYSATHYLDRKNKFCELVTRLPELSRLCVLGKDILKTRQSQGDLPQCSLLNELLKGDIVVQT